MPFKRYVKRNSRGRLSKRGLRCSKCDKEFEVGEPVWSQFQLSSRGRRVVAYLCQECYDSPYIEVEA